MGKVRDLTTAAAFSAVLYGVYHSGAPTAEDALSYNRSVEACANDLSAVGQDVYNLPADCVPFKDDTLFSGNWSQIDSSGRPYYYKPSYDEFTSNYPLLTAADEQQMESDAVIHDAVFSGIWGVVAFGALRFVARRRRQTGPRPVVKPAPQPPRQGPANRGQFNEDWPEWEEIARRWENP